MVLRTVATTAPHRSVKAELRRRSLPAVSLRVMERWAATRPKGSVQIARLRHSSSDRGKSAGTPDDEIAVQESRLWLDIPSRWRYEVDFPGGTGVFVTDGPLWWSYAPSVHALSNESGPERYPGQREHQESQLFHPDQVLAALTVTGKHVEERAGRLVDVLEAVARADSYVPSLPSGADTYQLVIDRERNVVLRMAAVADGIEFSSVEITSIEFDAPMDQTLFRIELPAGMGFTPPPRHTFRPSVLQRMFGRFLRARR